MSDRLDPKLVFISSDKNVNADQQCCIFQGGVMLGNFSSTKLN